MVFSYRQYNTTSLTWQSFYMLCLVLHISSVSLKWHSYSSCASCRFIAIYSRIDVKSCSQYEFKPPLYAPASAISNFSDRSRLAFPMRSLRNPFSFICRILPNDSSCSLAATSESFGISPRLSSNTGKIGQCSFYFISQSSEFRTEIFPSCVKPAFFTSQKLEKGLISDAIYRKINLFDFHIQ